MDSWRLRIGELAELAGVSTRILRHYERVGVLAPPDRSPNGYRTYPATALLDILEIRRLQDAGLSLSEAAGVLRDRAAGSNAAILDRINAVEAELDEEIERLRRRRSTLQDLRSSLAAGDALLAAGGLDSFAPIEEELRRLGLTDRAIDEQRRAWSALSSVHLPVAWREAVAAGLAQLERSPRMDGFAEAIDALAALRDVDPSSPAVTPTVAHIASIIRDLEPARASLALATPAAMPILAVVASCFTPAQILAMLLVIQTLEAKAAEVAE